MSNLSNAFRCMKNFREKVLGTIVKHSSQLLELPLSFMLVEENVTDKSVIGLAKESAIDDFIPRFYDLAFLHFEWFGQVGHLAKVQIWQCIKSWRFHVIS